MSTGGNVRHIAGLGRTTYARQPRKPHYRLAITLHVQGGCSPLDMMHTHAAKRLHPQRLVAVIHAE